MKNSNNQITGKFEKCPYQVLAYGENNCDVIYRTPYKGDWGDWDEPVQETQPDLSDAEVVLN
ncbi:hypothetical protein D3C85_175150 [compost metagenome]|jgi:hypothetical protein